MIMTAVVDYEVIRALGPVEIRKYPELTLATVVDASDNIAFSILFDYISGNNGPNHRIAMTAPVISNRPGGDKIAMTAPVISGKGSFSFILPSSYDQQSAPLPRDPTIKIERIKSRTVAVIKFSGRAHEQDLRSEEKILMDTLARSKIKSIGEPFLMRYNSPFTPGFLRHNELAVEIILKGSG
jgi:hypothetical protein